MTIICLVVDDEPLARKGMTHFIRDVPFLELAGTCASPLEALAMLKEKPIQLLFLDIRMPKMTGLELLAALTHPPLTVITTAYSDHALQGYDLNVLDYLVKPIPFERFVKAANKAKDLLELRHRAGGGQVHDADFFFVKCDGRYEKVMLDDLLYVEALQNYVVLHTTQRRLVSYLTFKGVEEFLPPDRFLKVQRSCIVSLAHIESIDGALIRIGKAAIRISRANREEVLAVILRNKLLRR